MKIKSLAIGFLLANTQLILAQNNTNFTQSNQFYVYGDATIIGNNILSKHETKPFNDVTKANDEINMKYIDVDEDNTTFSSSSASLNLPKGTRNIVNATLYWSGIYSFSEGKKKQKGINIVYEGNNIREENIHQIKLKTPQNSYLEIEGNILFDDFSNNKDNAPYVCYADVTSILRNNVIKNGEYTVANIRATKGFTSGGSSGGWLLYVVYETDTDIPQYISTYHGLVTIKKAPLDVNLKDFKTDLNGEVKASLSLSVLEGDRSIGGDQCLVFNKTKGMFVPLKNNIRPGRNFFNSSVSRDNTNISNRTPNSINSLGFDIAEVQLPNQNNELIANGATEMTLRLKTRLDQFHLYFAAFKTELDDDFYNNKKEELALQKTDSKEIITDSLKTKTEDLIASKAKNETVKENTQTVKNDTKKQPTTSNENKLDSTKNKVIEAVKKLKNKTALEVNTLDSGYYIVSNVFSSQELATKWENFLLKKDYKIKTYVNPLNQWIYVTIFNSLDPKLTLINLKKFRNKPYFKGLWIQKINL